MAAAGGDAAKLAKAEAHIAAQLKQIKEMERGEGDALRAEREVCQQVFVRGRAFARHLHDVRAQARATSRWQGSALPRVAGLDWARRAAA